MAQIVKILALEDVLKQISELRAEIGGPVADILYRLEDAIRLMPTGQLAMPDRVSKTKYSQEF